MSAEEVQKVADENQQVDARTGKRKVSSEEGRESNGSSDPGNRAEEVKHDSGHSRMDADLASQNAENGSGSFAGRKKEVATRSDVDSPGSVAKKSINQKNRQEPGDTDSESRSDASVRMPVSENLGRVEREADPGSNVIENVSKKKHLVKAQRDVGSIESNDHVDNSGRDDNNQSEARKKPGSQKRLEKALPAKTEAQNSLSFRENSLNDSRPANIALSVYNELGDDTRDESRESSDSGVASWKGTPAHVTTVPRGSVAGQHTGSKKRKRSKSIPEGKGSRQNSTTDEIHTMADARPNKDQSPPTRKVSVWKREPDFPVKHQARGRKNYAKSTTPTYFVTQTKY